ncbi:MAG: hypothetical protein ACI8WB_004430 [Phenylobacterium sp.]|jgi:hypothetical protein
MLNIKPIGQYFPLDEKGYIVNMAALDNVPPVYQPPINGIIELLATDNILASSIHSIFLRGSAAFGYAIEPISGIYLIVITNTNETQLSATIIATAQQWLTTHYPTFSLDIMVTGYDVTRQITAPRLDIVLKTQACCVFGEDVSEALENYRPGPEMFLTLPWLRMDLIALKSVEQSPQNLEPFTDFAKLLIRVSFELIMAKAGQYSKSLYYCIKSFICYYPDKEAVLKRFLTFYLNGAELFSPDIILAMMAYGEWLLNEIELVGYGEYLLGDDS